MKLYLQSMKKLPVILFIICTGFVFTIVAQDNHKKDSLLSLLSSAKDDSTRVMLLVRVSDMYSKNNFDSALLYMNKAVHLTAEKKLSTCDPYINNGFFVLYYYNNNYKKANEYGLKNVSI